MRPVVRSTFALVLTLVLVVPALVWAGSQREQAAGQVTLKMSWWGGDARHQGTIAAIELWNKAHPEITVEYAYSGWDGYHDKLTTQFAGRVAPDVIQVSRDLVEKYATSGVLTELTNYVPTHFADIDKPLWVWGNVGGKVYAVPAGTTAIGLVYNKQLFADLGLRAPTDHETWDSVLELSKQVTRDRDGDGRIDVWGFIHPSTITVEQLNDVVHQWGIDVFRDDMKSSTFDDPRMLEVWQMLQRFVEARVVPPAGEITLPEGTGWVDSGLVAMSLEPLSQLGAMQAVAKFEMDATTIPRRTADGVTGTSLNPPMVFSISAVSKHPKESVAFLSWFLTSPEAAGATGMVRGMYPTAKLRTAMASSMTKDDAKQARVLTQAGAEGKTYRGQQPLAGDVWEGIYTVEAEKLSFGQVDLKQFLRNIVSLADPVLRE